MRQETASDTTGVGNEQDGGGTPSTASRVKGAPIECIFPTPTPRREVSRNSRAGRQSPTLAIPMIFASKSSPAPRQHKSVEAFGTNARANSSIASGTSELEKQYMRRDVSKKNSQHFDQAFAVREAYHSTRSRVHRDSMIVLELQLNCEVEGEQSFLNDFLQNVSETYHRPINNITITLNTDVQIITSGSTEPAYLLHVTALPSEVAATKNMRATSLIQSFLAQTLNVPKDRGVITFQAIKEQDLATNGMTVTQEIEKAEQDVADEKRGLSLKSRQSNRGTKRSQLPTTSEAAGGIGNSRSDTPILSQGHLGDEKDDVKPSTRGNSSTGKIRGRKSIMSFWKR